MARLIKSIDKANGYIYTGTASVAAELKKLNVPDIDFEYYRVAEIQEKYVLGEENET